MMCRPGKMLYRHKFKLAVAQELTDAGPLMAPNLPTGKVTSFCTYGPHCNKVPLLCWVSSLDPQSLGHPLAWTEGFTEDSFSLRLHSIASPQQLSCKYFQNKGCESLVHEAW